MSVYLDIYITDAQKNMQTMWRRVIPDLHTPVPGIKYLLFSKDRAATWYFPDGGVERGEHYDTHLEVYVVWIRFTEPADFEHFGFVRMERTRP